MKVYTVDFGRIADIRLDTELSVIVFINAQGQAIAVTFAEGDFVGVAASGPDRQPPFALVFNPGDGSGSLTIPIHDEDVDALDQILRKHGYVEDGTVKHTTFGKETVH